MTLFLGIGAGGFWHFQIHSWGAFTEAFTGGITEAILECAKRNEPILAAQAKAEAAKTIKVFTPAPERTDAHRLEDARRLLAGGA